MIQQMKMAAAALLITLAAVLAGCSKPAAVLPKDSGSPLRVRLMSGSEYTETVANLFGQDIENGELPNDIEWTGQIIKDICYNNAKNYFGY